jgi:hypothetical protein
MLVVSIRANAQAISLVPQNRALGHRAASFFGHAGAFARAFELRLEKIPIPQINLPTVAQASVHPRAAGRQAAKS